MDKSELEALLSRIDVWLLIFGVIVVIGVAGESFFGIRHWWNSRKLQRIQQEESDELRAEIARLANETAAANARAAEADRARIELEAKLAPRTLSVEQHARLRSDLSKLAGQYVTITFINDSFEAAAFASQIRDVFSEAKWVITQFSPMTPGGNGLPIVRGVLIMTEPPEESRRAGAAVLGALQKQGVIASVLPFDRHGLEEMYAKSTDPADRRILVVVGSHP